MYNLQFRFKESYLWSWWTAQRRSCRISSYVLGIVWQLRENHLPWSSITRASWHSAWMPSGRTIVLKFLRVGNFLSPSKNPCHIPIYLLFYLRASTTAYPIPSILGDFWMSTFLIYANPILTINYLEAKGLEIRLNL